MGALPLPVRVDQPGAVDLPEFSSIADVKPAVLPMKRKLLAAAMVADALYPPALLGVCWRHSSFPPLSSANRL